MHAARRASTICAGWLGGVQLVNIAMDSPCVLIANQNETITTMTVAVEVKPTRSRMIPRGTPVWSKQKDGSNLFVCPKWDSNVCLNGVLANDVRFNKGDTELKEIAVVTGGVVSVRMDKGVDTSKWIPYRIICDTRLGEYRLVLNHAVRASVVGKGGGTGESGERGESTALSPHFTRVLLAIVNNGTIKGEDLAKLSSVQSSVANSNLKNKFHDESSEFKSVLEQQWNCALDVISSAKSSNSESYDDADIDLNSIGTQLVASFAAKMPGVSRSTAKKKAAVKKTAKAAMRK